MTLQYFSVERRYTWTRASRAITELGKAPTIGDGSKHGSFFYDTVRLLAAKWGALWRWAFALGWVGRAAFRIQRE